MELKHMVLVHPIGEHPGLPFWMFLFNLNFKKGKILKTINGIKSFLISPVNEMIFLFVENIWDEGIELSGLPVKWKRPSVIWPNFFKDGFFSVTAEVRLELMAPKISKSPFFLIMLCHLVFSQSLTCWSLPPWDDQFWEGLQKFLPTASPFLHPVTKLLHQ